MSMYRKKYLLLFTLLSLLELSYKCNCQIICKGVTANVKITTNNKGFHRDLNYRIKFDESNEVDVWPQGVCKMALQQHLPRGVFVSPDELNDFRRMHKVAACPFGDVDTEKPAHMSSPIRTYVYSPLNSSKMSITMPIHLRYHKAKEKGGYEKVLIKHPWVLLRCPGNVFKKCLPSETIPAPCGPCSPHKCQWHNISVIPGNKPVELSVPVGDLDMISFIAMGTLAAAFGGCLYVFLSISSIKDLNKHLSSSKPKHE